MASKQEFKKNLIDYLEGSGIFFHVIVKGDLDYEQRSLFIEYQKNPDASEKDFWRAIGILEKKVNEVTDTYLSSGLILANPGPDEHGKHSFKITRVPREGMDNATYEFLRRLSESLKDKYVFS